LTWIAIAAVVIAGVSLLVSLYAIVRMRGMADSTSRSAAPVNTDPSQNAMRIDLLGSQLDSVTRRLDAAEAHGKLSIQRVGVVRYNPFADTGSNQSFVLAMLDAGGDGFVLSSLHSRQQTRVFLKQVSKGKVDTGLSEEESEAIRRALEG
jgi:Protein of unknown function (DUF4446)